MAVNSPSTTPDSVEFSLTPQGDYAGRPPIKLTKPVVIVGTEEHCHLHLVSSTVSRHHALIVRETDRVYVCDLGSRTKVLINGQEQREAELADGDELRIGKFSFKFAASRPSDGAAIRPDPARIIVDGQALRALDSRLLLIGRTAGSDVTLVEQSVSARHAILFEVGDRRYVRDLDSRTGTFLNGEKIHQHEIKSGDELRIGESILKLAEPAESPTEPIGTDEALLLEPEPIDAPVEPAEPADLVVDHPTEEPLPLELEPAAPASGISDEPLPLELEPESSPEPEVTEHPAAPAAAAIGLAGEPAPLELEPEPAPEPEAAEQTAPPEVDATEPAEQTDESVDPLEPVAPIAEHPIEEPPPLELEPAEPASGISDEPLPLELEPESSPEPEVTEHPAAPAAAAIGLAGEPAPLELEPEPAPEPEAAGQAAVSEVDAIDPAGDTAVLEPEPLLPTPETPEKTAASEAPTIDEPHHATAPEIETPSEIEPPPQTAPPAAPMIDLSDAPEAHSVPEAAFHPAPRVSVIDLLAEFAAKQSEEFKPVELEPETLPEPETAEEETPPPAAATIDLSDALAPLELEPEPTPPPAIDPLSETEPQEATEATPPPLPVDETPPVAVEKSPVVDSDFKPVDLDVDWTPPESAAEQTPIDVEPALPAAAAPSAEDETPAKQEKPRRGRPRRSPDALKPSKTRRMRFKRVPPRTEAEESSPFIELPAPVESVSPDIEPPAVEVPDLEIDRTSDQSPDSAPSVAVPIAAQMQAPAESESPVLEPPAVEAADLEIDRSYDPPLDDSAKDAEPIIGVTASGFTEVFASDHGGAPAPTEPPAAEPLLTEPPSAEPEPILESPIVSIGNFAFLGGGTVNLDHFLGGMPIELQELPPAPVGFGQVRIDLSGKLPLPQQFSSAPLPPVSPQPETVVTPPAPTPPPLPSASPASAVGPAPAPAPPTPQSEPPPLKAVLKAAPRMFRRLSKFANAPDISMDNPPRQRAGDGFAQITTAFDGLAPAVRGTDVFSNFDALAINDAAFGGARLTRPDEYIVPETPEIAARRASDPEHDFAEDDFWNRTDEEEGLPPMNIPPAEPAVSPIARDESPAPIESAASTESAEPAESPAPAESAATGILPEPQPIVPEAQTAGSGEETVATDNSIMEFSEPPSTPLPELSESDASAPAEELSALQAPPDAPEDAPPIRHRRRFRIPFLMPAILLVIGLALGAIWRFIPVRSQIVGKMTFENYNWTPGTQDGTDFEAAQRRLLGSDQTHLRAVEILRRDHPDISPGFLQVPDLLSRTVSSVLLTSNHNIVPAQTVLQLSRNGGGDKEADRLRVLSLLQAMFDSTAPLLDNNRRLRDSQQQAQQALDETRQKLDGIRNELADVQPVIDAQPPMEQMAQLAARKVQLEKAREEAEEAVNRDRDGVARLEAAAAKVDVAAATQPDSFDPQLNQMRQQLADLSAEIDSARSDQASGAFMARQQLEAAAKQFSDQLSAADAVLGASSQLRQFVDSARDSQAKARDLINMLIVDGEDLEKQLEDTRRDVEDLIQSRQQRKWADDPQLRLLRENLDSAQHRYNANVGDGIKDPRILDPLQKEIDDWSSRVQARQAQLGVDPGEIKVEEGLNLLVQSLRNKLQSEKQETDEVLDPVEKQLSQLAPVVAALPQAQQALARQIRDRLDALNEAREKYAKAVGDGDGELAPSAQVTDLRKKMADLRDQIARRQEDVVRQKLGSLDAQRAHEVAAANRTLVADEQKLDAARNANGEFLLVYEEKEAEHAAAEAAQAKKINLLDDQRTAYAELETAQRNRDEKQSAAERTFDIKPIGDSDVIATAPDDPRMMYSLLVLGAGVVAFAVLTFISHLAAERSFRLKHSGHGHSPTTISDQLDSLILPMAEPPPGGH